MYITDEEITTLVSKWLERAANMDNTCFLKAKEAGEQTFTLRAQDKSSPRTICFWILENIETTPLAKLMDALIDAYMMTQNKIRRYAD